MNSKLLFFIIKQLQKTVFYLKRSRSRVNKRAENPPQKLDVYGEKT
jgi:hypothetical protein